MLLKLVLDVLDVATKGAGLVDALPGLDFEGRVLPVLGDIVAQLALELELLVGGVGDFLDVVLEGKQVHLEEL